MRAHDGCVCGEKKARAMQQRERKKGRRQETAGKSLAKTTDPTAEIEFLRWQP
jgi:hypothetical protein